MIMILYIVVCGFEFRLFNLYDFVEIPLPGGRLNLEDLLLFLLFVLSMPAYFHQRQIMISVWFRRVEFAWLLFVGVLIIATLNSPADNLTQRLGLLRFVQPFLLFFPTIALITSEKRLWLVLKAGIFFAVVGTVLTIAQSLHGLNNIFDSPLYSVGAWGGNKQIVGGLARVNLPISNWLAFVLLVVLAVLLHRWRWWAAILGTFLSIALYLNFARSLWLGLTAAFGVELFLEYRAHLLSSQTVSRLFGVATFLILAVFLGPFVGFQNLGGALADRIDDGISIFRSSSGDWGERMSQMNWVLDYFQKSRWETWLFGFGTHYRSLTGFFIDLGFPATLMSVGVFGLLALFWLFFVCAISGFHTMKGGVEEGSELIILAGLAVPAQVVLMLIYQQWLIPNVASILSFSSAIALAVPVIFEQPDESVSTDSEDTN